MQINIHQAFQLLRNCKAVVLVEKDEALSYLSLDEITGDPDNLFLYLRWEINGHERATRFAENPNRHVDWTAPILILVDEDGDLIPMRLLVEMDSSTHWFDPTRGSGRVVSASKPNG